MEIRIPRIRLPITVIGTRRLEKTYARYRNALTDVVCYKAAFEDCRKTNADLRKELESARAAELLYKRNWEAAKAESARTQHRMEDIEKTRKQQYNELRDERAMRRALEAQWAQKFNNQYPQKLNEDVEPE